MFQYQYRQCLSVLITIPLFVFTGALDLLGQITPSELSVSILEAGKSIERPLAGGQAQKFQIELSPNQYANILVIQKGVDVIVRLFDAGGKPIIDFDNNPRTEGTESIDIAVRDGSTIGLTIEPKQKNAPAGRFEIKLAQLRGASEQDLALDDARRLVYQARGLWIAGKYAEALPLAEKAVAISEKELGRDSDEYGRALFILANIYSDNGGLDKAVELYKECIQLKEKAVGKDDLSMTPLLNNYAAVLKDKGDYPEAASLFARVLEIRKKFLEPGHLLIASAYLNLGNVYRLTGNTSKAAESYSEALRIREKALPPDHPDIATTLNNIANLYDDVERAEPLYKKALAIREAAFGPNSQEVAQTLYNFAIMYGGAGDFAKADQMCRHSLSIFENVLGKDHYLTSYPLTLLGGIDRVAGRFQEAEELYKRSVAIKETSLGPYHPDLAGTLTDLANLYTLIGDVDRAVTTQTRANEIYEFNMALNLTVGSEREKLAYLGTLDFISDQTLSLNAGTASKSSSGTSLGLTSVLRRKGRVLDAMSDSMRVLRARLGSQDQAIIGKLNDVSSKLSSLVVSGPPEGGLDVYRKQMDGLIKEREAIEDKISRLGSGYLAAGKPVTLEAVRNAIPDDAALIEFALYHPISPNTFEFSPEGAESEDRMKRPAHYAAYVLHRRGEPKFVELGEATAIDGVVRELRKAVRDPKRSDVKSIARKLDEKVMAPLRSIVGSSKHLLISSDGELNLVPFEAMVAENDTYLIENYDITYLTSGRDLLRIGSGRDSGGPPLIVANPTYGVNSGSSVAKTIQRDTGAIRKRDRQSVTITRSISETFFTPLSGSAEEGRAIKKLFPESILLEGPHATKASIKAAVAPRLLHIATHGFFLTEEATAPGGFRGSSGTGHSSENPLMRSGLALAGANRHDPSNSDGILSSLEASGLDLWGTKLVVLSACDTGVGEVKTGEGVYGLRRSFIEAGAESLVMSLWPVSDAVTRELMISYYKNLNQGMGRGEALRQVQLEMLKQPERKHPFYWASFIESGDWRPIR